LTPLLRAVGVWAVILATVVLPRLQPAAAAPVPLITQAAAFTQHSLLADSRAQRARAAEAAQAEAWSQEFSQGLDTYQARVLAEAEVASEAARIAALDNHPPPPAWIGQIISAAFSPLGQAAVTWALRVAWCESRYHPNSVNSSSHASGLFQFLPSTWAGTPWHAQSPFDPTANAQAAAWLYKTYGPQRWVCQ
jgi:hypothetical protein